MTLFLLFYIYAPSFAEGENNPKKIDTAQEEIADKDTDSSNKGLTDSADNVEDDRDNVEDDRDNVEKDTELPDDTGEVCPPCGNNTESASWGTLLLGIFVGTFFGFVAGRKIFPTEAITPKRNAQIGEKKQIKHSQSIPIQPTNVPTIPKPTPSSEPIAPEPNLSDNKVSPSFRISKPQIEESKQSQPKDKNRQQKGIRIGTTTSVSSTSNLPKINPGLSLDSYFIMILEQFPNIANELSSSENIQIMQIQESFRTLIQRLRSIDSSNYEAFKKVVTKDLIPVIDDIASLISKLSEGVFIDNKNSEYLSWLIEIVFEHISNECIRLHLFRIDKIIPFKTSFDPEIHHAISASKYGYDFQNKIVVISKVQLSNPTTDEILQFAEVIVGQ